MLQSILQSIQTWFRNRLQPLFGWSPVETVKAAPSEEILLQLPNELRQELLEQLHELPSNPTHLEQLTEDFTSFFDSWDQRYCATDTSPNWNIEGCGNVWIIVGASTSDSPMVIADFIQDLADSSYQYKKLPIQSCQYGSRPGNNELRKYLQTQFGHRLPSPESDRAIAVIPCLENHFLRNIDGLEGIDYLRDSLLTDTSIFWIIGVGQVAWQYLQAISALESYSDHVTHLEKLSGEQLEQWFKAVTTELDISFKSSSLRAEPSDNDLSWRTQYFKSLARESKGVDAVAVQLFLETLQLREETAEDNETKELSEEESPREHPTYALSGAES
ncbi:MAG: hypothetical protein ACFCA4_05035 [Cyanophyceae cyanobacterium]